MKMVYICSPLKGDITGNIEKAKRYTKFALMCGAAPVTPHFFALCIDDNEPYERELGMNAGRTLLGICDEIWVFGAERSEGMKKEIDYAERKLRIPVLYIGEKYVDSYLGRLKGGDEDGS